MPFEEVYVQGHRCVVVRPAGLAPDAPVVLVLHGFGQNGEVAYENFYWQMRFPPWLLVFPDGPLRVPHLSPAIHAWYDRSTHSYQDMKNSRQYLFAVMDYFSAEPSDPSIPGNFPGRPVIVMGESQGGVESLETGLNYKGNIAGIISINGFIEYPEKTLDHPAARRSMPILMVNGKFDPVIQEEQVFDTVRALKRARYHPVLREYPVGHQMTHGMLEEVSVFLREGLSPNRQAYPSAPSNSRAN